MPVRGDCDPLDAKVRRLLPPGSAFAVHVSNGHGTYPVLVERRPGGEGVTTRHLLEPAWNHSFVATSTLRVNSDEDALVVHSLPIFRSLPVTPGGSPLKVVVRGSWASDGGEHTLTASRATEALSEADRGLRPVPSLTFQVNGQPASSYDARATTAVLGVPTLAKLPLTLRIQESAGVALKQGTELVVRLPRGWTATADQAANQPHWHVSANATDRNGSISGSDVHAVLLQDVDTALVPFTLQATYLGDRLEWYPFHATLNAPRRPERSRAPRARRRLPRHEPHRHLPHAPARRLPPPTHGHGPSHHLEPRRRPPRHARRPRPRQRRQRPAPRRRKREPRPRRHPHRRDHRRGRPPIFGSVRGLSGGGAWTAHGDRLVWRGAHSSASGALDLAFEVRGRGTASPPMSQVPFQPPASFDGGHEGRLLQRSAPGLHWDAFLPKVAAGAYRGYDAADLGTVRTTPIHWTTPLPGKATYGVDSLPTLRDTAQGSAIGIERRTVAIGGEAVVDVDARAFVGALETLGLRPNMTLNVYPPWATGPQTPIRSIPDLLSTTSGAHVTGPGQATYHLDVPPSWLFGPYVVEIDVTWEQGLLGPATGQPPVEGLIQKTRLYDDFLVTPPDHHPIPSPIYDVHLVTWMQDWG